MTELPAQNDLKTVPLTSQYLNTQTTPDIPQNGSNVNSSPQNIDTFNQVNQSYNQSGANVIYKTPYNGIICLLVSLFFIIGIGMEILIIFFFIVTNTIDRIYLLFIPLIFFIISIIIGSGYNLYYSFNIDSNSGVIHIDIKKMCFCSNKKKIVLIKDIQKVIVETDFEASYKYKGVIYIFFEINFILYDGRIVKGCSGIADYNEERKKAFSILRDSLPENIIFEGDFIS